jgi:predicted ATPase/class 3 adenylate cyclase
MGTNDLLPVTLLFTDIEGSTRLLRSLGDEGYRQIQVTLSGLLRSMFENHQGVVLQSQGDAFFVAFTRSPMDAIAAALQCQRTLASHEWPDGREVRVRIGIHTGLLRRQTTAPEGEYVGLDVHHAARLCEAGHGGQVLVSEATQALVAKRLSEDVDLRALGEHQLRDLAGPELIYQIVAAGIRSEFPPLRALGLRLFNLPIPRTSLLGRDKEVAELLDLLPRAESSLITLSGPAGTGKTRLAIAVASRASSLFKDGICFVALAPILDAELVASTIVRRLGLQESGPVSLEEILVSFLRDRELLLVLDNFEHLLPAAPLVATLLSACPRLKILATSRGALKVRGEREYPVPSLGVPNLDWLPSHDEFDRYPAVALFAERAGAAMSRFKITSANFADVAALCTRLDGLPLAIELAAARASLLTPREMLARLRNSDTSLDLLAGGPRDAPARHRTLRGAIGWSLGLLDADDQVLFRRLSVFVGGFTLAAASAVALLAASPLIDNSAPAVSLLDGLGKLAENSLVQRVDRAGTEARFSMLETIREYGREQLLASGELAAARRCHAAYFLTLAEAAEKEAGGPHQADWMRRLDDEQANLRAALAWSLSEDCGDAHLSARLAGALWVFWFRRAYLREGSRWIQQAYSAGEATMAPELRAKLLTGDGSLARMLGDFSRAEMLLERATELWRDLGDAEGTAWALSHLGLVKQWLGQLDAGVELLEESLELRRPSEDNRAIARSLFNLAVAEDFRCNYTRAAQLYEQTLEVQRRVSDTWGIGRVLGYWAKVLLRWGEHARAESLCQEALGLSSQVADKWGIGLAQAGFGGVAWARRDYGKAAELLKQSLVTFRDVGSRDRVAECLQDIASLSRQVGAIEQSVRLSACAETVQHASRLALWPAVQTRRDEDMAAARASLGNKAFELAWSKGRSMSTEEAIDDALAAPETFRP